MTTLTEGLQTLKLEQLHESPWNPRKLFDQAKLAELADSITANGIIEPLLARPNAKGFELAAGHRRYRAAKLAGLVEAPVIIRAMTDVQFLEVLMIDNLQREDLTALEEAEGYHALMTKGQYTVQRLAERIGRSEKYVYDRVKLRELNPVAQKLVREGTITAGHGILLARLKMLDQQRAIDDGLFQVEQLLLDPDSGKTAFERGARKAVSVRELQAWIDKYVRFETKAVDAMLFPETAAAIGTQKPADIIPLTHDHFVQESARDGRTFTPATWKRADGTGKSKACDKAKVGVIVVGPGRGQAFKVCVDKKGCKLHWASERREAKKRAVSDGGSGASDRYAREDARRREEQALEEAARARFRKSLPAILEAIAEKVKKAPTRAGGLLAQIIIDGLDGRSRSHAAADYVIRGTSTEDLVRHVAFMAILDDADDYQEARTQLGKRAKAFGIDVKTILDEVAPVKEAEAKGKKK